MLCLSKPGSLRITTCGHTLSIQRQQEVGELPGESERHQLWNRQELGGGSKRVSEVNSNYTTVLHVQQEVVQVAISDANDVTG